eukprot:Amastigsp_a509672_144.p3 type:complete len:131 gc:universal Amastigsp_a509672_144:836-444(-)
MRSTPSGTALNLLNERSSERMCVQRSNIPSGSVVKALREIVNAVSSVSPTSDDGSSVREFEYSASCSSWFIRPMQSGSFVSRLCARSSSAMALIWHTTSGIEARELLKRFKCTTFFSDASESGSDAILLS